MTKKERMVELLEELMVSYTDELTKISDQYEDIMPELASRISALTEPVGTMCLVMKYLLFDLEATRRERDKLRAYLGDRDD